MNRLIFGSSLTCVVFLLVGSYLFPDNTIMWFAGTSLGYTLFRLVMVIALVAVLITNPPRTMYMRLAMGALSLSLLFSGVVLLYSDVVHVLDMLLFVLLGVTFAIEALEFNEDELTDRATAIHEQHTLQMEAVRDSLVQQIISIVLLMPPRSYPWKDILSNSSRVWGRT